ncbi:GNAT family N-acetyltransferase [Shimia ponticola]|uniref:GNAT family N-acetyltransferase n=1 Tax=Shimia ponticola TaxID=2582893 RepID=UPI0011BE06E2|nr:GNAT family N-acetyltransferase [Shimia ponticola]
MNLTVAPTDDIATCQDLRRIVFIEEQGVSAADERDGKDGEALHVIAHLDGEPIGTARVLPFGTTAKIGRVCVLPDARGSGAGVALIEACHEMARMSGATRAILGAQLSALGFYERLGYRAYGEVFDDAGIDHRMMELGL